MKTYVCELCGYEYNPKLGDPDNGIEPGTDFEDLPDDSDLSFVRCDQGRF